MTESKKRPRPVTCCTRCGGVGYSITLANGKCGRMYGGRRCHGINRSAVGEKDWAECLACWGTGRDVGTICHECEGSGWNFVREHA